MDGLKYGEKIIKQSSPTHLTQMHIFQTFESTLRDWTWDSHFRPYTLRTNLLCMFFADLHKGSSPLCTNQIIMVWVLQCKLRLCQDKFDQVNELLALEYTYGKVSSSRYCLNSQHLNTLVVRSYLPDIVCCPKTKLESEIVIYSNANYKGNIQRQFSMGDLLEIIYISLIHM